MELYYVFLLFTNVNAGTIFDTCSDGRVYNTKAAMVDDLGIAYFFTNWKIDHPKYDRGVYMTRFHIETPYASPRRLFHRRYKKDPINTLFKQPTEFINIGAYVTMYRNNTFVNWPEQTAVIFNRYCTWFDRQGTVYRQVAVQTHKLASTGFPVPQGYQLTDGNYFSDQSLAVKHVIRVNLSSTEWMYKVSFHPNAVQKPTWKLEVFYQVQHKRVWITETRNVTMNPNEKFQIALYRIPEKNASFGYTLIGVCSFPTLFYDNRTEVSLVDNRGNFNRHFYSLITDRSQALIHPNAVWFGCSRGWECFTFQPEVLLNYNETYLIYGATVAVAPDIYKPPNQNEDIDTFFPGVNYVFDAFSDPHNLAYLFEENTFRVYSNGKAVGGVHETNATFIGVSFINAAIFVPGSPNYVYIFSDDVVHQYAWPANGTMPSAAPLRTIPMTYIDPDLPEVIDTAEVFGNQLYIFKDHFFLTLPMDTFFYWPTYGHFRPLWNSGILGCDDKGLPKEGLSEEFLEQYTLALAPKTRPLAKETTFERKSYTVPRFTKPAWDLTWTDFVIILLTPVPIMVIVCSLSVVVLFDYIFEDRNVRHN